MKENSEESYIMTLFTRRRLLAGLLLSAVLLSGCARVPTAPASGSTPESSSSASSQSQGQSGSGASDPAGSAQTGTEKDAPQPAGSSGQAAPPAGDSLPVSGSAAPYDFTQPCPASPAVDTSYFEDAAFVGDSRTEGFMLYSGIGCGEDLSSVGISIFKLADKKVITRNGQEYTLLEALAQKQYGKVYLCLGVNELGYNNDTGFYNAYCQAIDSIRACQPNAVIYIQGLIPLNESVIAASGGSDYLTNEHLRVYNELMKQVAQEKRVVFLDLYSEFVGPDGQLPAEASNDGVHMKGSYYKQWLEYLKTHTVSYETLYPNGEEQA